MEIVLTIASLIIAIVAVMFLSIDLKHMIVFRKLMLSAIGIIICIMIYAEILDATFIVLPGFIIAIKIYTIWGFEKK